MPWKRNPEGLIQGGSKLFIRQLFSLMFWQEKLWFNKQYLVNVKRLYFSIQLYILQKPYFNLWIFQLMIVNVLYNEILPNSSSCSIKNALVWLQYWLHGFTNESFIWRKFTILFSSCRRRENVLLLLPTSSYLHFKLTFFQKCTMYLL